MVWIWTKNLLYMSLNQHYIFWSIIYCGYKHFFFAFQNIPNFLFFSGNKKDWFLWPEYVYRNLHQMDWLKTKKFIKMECYFRGKEFFQGIKLFVFPNCKIKAFRIHKKMRTKINKSTKKWEKKIFKLCRFCLDVNACIYLAQ